MLTFQNASPESVGIPSGCIIQFINRLQAHQIPMHSFLLMRKDKLVTEAYYKPFTANTLHRMFSITKSFTSIAIGLLADEGRLHLDDKIISYFPDMVPPDVHPYIAAMSIRDMLMMRTCHASTTYKFNLTQNWVESFFTAKPTHPSGRLFHYDTSAAHTLCALTERLTGMPMLDYLKQKLSPLGLSKTSYILKDPFGVSMGGSGLVATSMDLLRFAYFISHNGLVEGQQLLSAEYIQTATTKLTDTQMTAPCLSEAQGYGYLFWRNQHGGYVCYGMGGQLIIFLPDYDFICVTTADTQGIAGGNQIIYDALYEEILPWLSEKELPPDAQVSDTYRDSLHSLHLMPLVSKAAITPASYLLKNAQYRVADNSAGFETIGISFQKNTGAADASGILSFTWKGHHNSISFGFGKLHYGRFPIYDMNYAASGLWVTPNTLYIKAHIIDSSLGSVHFQLVFGDHDLTVFMKKQEESLFNEFNGHLYCTI